MRNEVAHDRGGTFQNRFERDVVWDRADARLAQLDIGDRSLVFGRIDTEPGFEPGRQRDEDGAATDEGSAPGPPGNGDGESYPQGDTFYIGRIAVADEHSNPVVVDWRAPIAE